MASEDEVYHVPEDIEVQEIGQSARMGVPDIQEPEAEEPQPRIWQFYAATRIFSLTLILGSLITGWITYSLMPAEKKFLNNECKAEDLKRRFMIIQVIGTVIALGQLVNICYQLKVNTAEKYKIQEPLNYVDGRSEVLFILLLVFIPQLTIMTDFDTKCRLNTTSTTRWCDNQFSNMDARDSADVKARLAFAIIGFLSCHFRFIFSRNLPRLGRKGVADEFGAYKLEKTKQIQTLIFLDKKCPRILKFVGLDFLCICRKIKIPLPCFLGYCILDHCTPVWRWMYCVLECWIGRLTICPKKERGEVWYVNRARRCRRRPGFFCINKEDPFWLGEYTMFILGLATVLTVYYVSIYLCFLPGAGIKKLETLLGIYNKMLAFL
ncbi:uncharacterized protein LOC133188103 [Saccostrea echinata]|uniref:uncharacterized protein LOC133188103 n=1 Tax=Saccostrea echinata TaxID=191078 RepID=UPI002A82B77E|nr:uncharacterized protein LOC133188103 [Saccostrea echinata]